MPPELEYRLHLATSSTGTERIRDEGSAFFTADSLDGRVAPVLFILLTILRGPDRGMTPSWLGESVYELVQEPL
jgi:hypothetical protein